MATDQALDFSFHKGNPLAVADDLESPKPMPKPPTLPVVADGDVETTSAQEDKLSSCSNAAVEVLETLSISTAVAAPNDENASPTDSEASPSCAKDDFISAKPSAGTSVPPVPKFSDQQVSSPRAKPRAKIPYEKGFTQMDWLKLTRTGADLAGLKGGTNRRLIPMAEVKRHKNEDDAWTVLKGRVYNISPYLKFHPGGVDMLMKGAGKDCTALFNKYHSWVNAEFLLEKCLVGFLDVEECRDP